ncbi:endothelial lipase-like [Vespa crabro]|uniref:endothelial lipase-like n=1 Tax=Vespa crabro TaxID=7445 RepID=UPI001F017407|nr:endothelial lipase-like [Vespa crabro]
MKTHLLICFTFFYIVIGLSVSEETENQFQFGPEDIELLNSNLYVLNDDHNLVSLTKDLLYAEEDAESEKDTLKDLHNRVFFYLYTINNRKEPDVISINDLESLKKSNFNFNRSTQIITHGWINSHNSDSCILIRDAYLNHNDYNVIVIDWSKISVKPYFWTVIRVKMVSQYVSTMLDFLEKEGMNLSTTTMVGHSLGAHIVGLAAHYAKGTVNYIIGLDPALPGFIKAKEGSRISQGDANYVEIIHTNGGVLGFLNSIGDVDFYPNGGVKQAGCIVDAAGSCSHLRAYELFAESINSKIGFHAKKCENYVRFKLGLCNKKLSLTMGGIKKHFIEKGIFFLDTNPVSPFAKG